jgi:hypothetical protein
MLIRVEQGKGRKDRNVMLSPHLLERDAIARMAARGLPPPRCARTPEEQAAVDAQIERVRQMFGIPAGGFTRRGGGGQGVPPRARDLTSVSAIAAAVINHVAPS